MVIYIKKELKLLPIIVVIYILVYGMVTIADSYIVNSSEVTFDNTGTSITSTDVQNVISEEYNYATNYTSMGSEVDGIDTAIGTATLATTDKTLTGATNEIKARVVSELVTSPITWETAAATNSTFTMYKSGKLRYGHIRVNTSSVSSTGNVLIGTIASGERPVQNLQIAVTRNTVGTPDTRMVLIGSNGKVYFYGGTASVPYYGVFAYLVS